MTRLDDRIPDGMAKWQEKKHSGLHETVRISDLMPMILPQL